MDQLHVFIILLVGAVASSQAHINGSVLNLTVSHGGNATLYCDCKSSSGVYIVWYRNCSHVNQPTLVMKTRYQAELLPLNHKYKDNLHPFPRFHLVKNESSESYDLLITNISDSDEGLYYCGTEQVNTKDGKEKDNYIRKSYGNVTRMILTYSMGDHSGCSSSGGFASWRLVVFTPAIAILSSLLSFILVYHFCQKSDKEPQVQRRQTKQKQDEEMCLTQVVFHRKDGYTQQQTEDGEHNTFVCSSSKLTELK
ncbi:uncharacterized protein LOC118117935 isoform X4 [Hippoglossus stenolepis]|uniref:uncharacterized protein LOC118117935 isoform X4 n=1 Tax=Hippoglossus stenolepis TaxID=195615 RepID=UPI001FAF8D39|nr:uncharacterized protein LOC118117935 isoform X4 [Hippoglossus stenolepis]